MDERPGFGRLLALLAGHDPYLLGHAWRVSRYASHVGAELGLDPGERVGLKQAAFLHDIGKTQLPIELLRTPRRLTEEEYSLIQRHCELGAEILSDAGMERHALIALCHHERWDGAGYPSGVPAAECPIEARIILVADAFDAMTSRRTYAPSLDVPAALAEIERCSGAQFDPECFKALLALEPKGVLGSTPVARATASA